MSKQLVGEGPGRQGWRTSCTQLQRAPLFFFAPAYQHEVKCYFDDALGVFVSRRANPTRYYLFFFTQSAWGQGLNQSLHFLVPCWRAYLCST